MDEGNKNGPAMAPSKPRWETPKVNDLGKLKDFINAGNPGKSAFGSDGGAGGGPEMFMA